MPTYANEYQDLDFDFTANPITGDVAKVKNVTSVKRGINNILLTENSERLFQPEVGSGLKNLLFEPMTNLTAQLLEDEVRSAIDAWENRAQVININVIPEEEYNRYRVAVVFRLMTDTTEQQTEVLLSRER
jgi:phage baseplate assembly protein W